MLFTARPLQDVEIESLQEFSNKKGNEYPIQLWDVSYWARLQKKELYGYLHKIVIIFYTPCLNIYITFSSYDEVEWSEYFPVDRVLDGLFNLCKQLYGIRILEVPNKANLWHSDVKYYEVLHENEPTIMAGFYLDLSSRLVP